MRADLRVVDVERRKRYELHDAEGNVLAYADRLRLGGVVTLPHTVVDPGRRGQGLGAILVRGVLDDARARGEKVVPDCWYVRSFIDEHDEYRDLLLSEG